MAGFDSSSFLRLLPSVGPRQRELTGAVDLVSHYGLQDLYSHFCKKSLPVSIADSQYLQQVVGDTEIRKGEGMELMQLIESPETFAPPVKIEPLDMQLLQWAFSLREDGPIELPEADKGVPTISGNVKDEKDRKHKKKHKKHRSHRHKDKEKEKDKGKDKDKDRVKGENGEDRTKKHKKKKRKHEGAEEEGDGHKHKKKKHKHSSKVEGAAKNGK